MRQKFFSNSLIPIQSCKALEATGKHIDQLKEQNKFSETVTKQMDVQEFINNHCKGAQRTQEHNTQTKWEYQQSGEKYKKEPKRHFGAEEYIKLKNSLEMFNIRFAQSKERISELQDKSF